jgi:hypothetical protein
VKAGVGAVEWWPRAAAVVWPLAGVREEVVRWLRRLEDLMAECERILQTSVPEAVTSQTRAAEREAGAVSAMNAVGPAADSVLATDTGTAPRTVITVTLTTMALAIWFGGGS